MASISLRSDELIDDRAVKTVADDLFDHGDFVDELEGVAGTVPTPANVALYAPWGSGKSGLAYMLEERFKDRDDIEYVRFDALKYAEAPLRRQFLLKLSDELEVARPELYDTSTENDIKIPPRDIGLLLVLFFGALAALMAAVFLGSALYGLFAHGPHDERFHDALGWAAPKAFVPAVLLSVVAALLGNQFKVERKVEAPRSDEQFEDAFCSLVTEAIGVRPAPGCPKKIDDSKKRLVVFIDELDRCSPIEVATVLETLRTFLEVDGCVFIVAADQHALEEALSRRVKQATPSNTTAPYYSAGSAYLDKIFQYQLSLPPLKPQRLTSFALKLLEGKAGVWDRVQQDVSLEDVISVLVPTHVDSPRRVKALLNNFALLYRLAEHRAASEKLGPNVSSRAMELAKLSCLRLEFPLFAADFTLDPRMPELVRKAIDKEDLPKHLRPEVAARVRLWAAKKLAVDEVLAQSAPTEADVDAPSPAMDDAPDAQKGSEPDMSQDAAQPAGKSALGATRAKVQTQHAEQLLRYLRKTAQISGPGRDLIYLESAAASIEGIDAASADELERAAVDAEVTTVQELIGSLEGEAQRAGILLLAHIVGHSAVGVEGDNAVRTLMAALQVRTVDLGDAADRAAAAISAHRYKLGQRDLLAALELAEQCSHVAGPQLRARVLRDDAVLTDDALRTAVLRVAKDALGEQPDRVAAVAASAIAESGAAVAESLLELDDDVALRVIDAAKPKLRLVDPDTNEPDGHRSDQLGEALYVLVSDSGRRALSDRLAAVMLECESDEATGAVHWQTGRLTATRDARLAKAAIGCLSTRPLAEVGAWLAVVDPSALPADDVPALKDLIDDRVTALWRGHVAGDTSVENMEHLAAALDRFRGSELMSVASSIPEDIHEALAQAVASEESAQARTDQLDMARRFANLGWLTEQQIADMALMTVAASVANGHGSTAREGLIKLVADHHADASPIEVKRLRNALADAGPIWPAEVESWVIELSSQLEGDDSESPYDTAQIRSFVQEYGVEFSDGLGRWLRAYAGEADEVAEALSPMLAAVPPSEVGSALSRQVQWWRKQPGESNQHSAFLKRLVGRFVGGEPVDRDWLRTARIELAAPILAPYLAELYEGGVNAPQARQILGVWELMRVEDVGLVRDFFRRVLVPLARVDDESMYRVAKEFVHLLKDAPADRRKAVRDHLRDRAKQFGDVGDLEQSFERAGLKKKNLLRRDQDV